MNLQEFNLDNSQGVKPTQNLVNLHETGRISFSKQLMRELNITRGTKLSFFQDKDKPTEWYIAINTPNGIPVITRESGKETGRGNFQCKAIVETFFLSLKYTSKSVSLIVSNEPEEKDGVKYYQLMTGHLAKKIKAEQEAYQFNNH